MRDCQRPLGPIHSIWGFIVWCWVWGAPIQRARRNLGTAAMRADGIGSPSMLQDHVKKRLLLGLSTNMWNPYVTMLTRASASESMLQRCVSLDVRAGFGFSSSPTGPKHLALECVVFVYGKSQKSWNPNLDAKIVGLLL